MSVGVVAIVKNEAAGILEWVAFHQVVGVERFFIYDNGSSDGTPDLLDGRDGVTVHDWPGEIRQLAAYEHALHHHRYLTDWLAFIDADEFLYSPAMLPLPVVLARHFHPEVDAVGACWAMYGTSGIAEQPPLVLPNFTRRAAQSDPVNRHVKSILRAWPHRALDPHHFDCPTIDELGRELEGPFAHTPTWQLLRVNHYWSKSEQHAAAKARQPRADNLQLRALDAMLSGTLNAVEDDEITAYVPLVKARLERMGYR